MPRLIRISRVLCLLIISALLTYFPPSSYSISSQNVAQAQRWEPNKALLNRLAAPSEIEEFQLSPPQNYIPQTQSGEFGSKATAWASRARRDGTRGQVMVLTVRLLPEEVKQFTLEEILSTFLERLSQRRKHWSRTPAERGTINGLTFVRARWSGTDVSLGQKLHGFNYVTVVGDKLIQLSSQDVEPHQKEALELAESSALTFKKR